MKKNRPTIQKALCLILALVMVLGMGVSPAFAAAPTGEDPPVVSEEPAPEVTEQDVIDHKAGEKAASDEGGFRVSRERSGEEGNNQNRRRRAVQTRERTEDGE